MEEISLSEILSIFRKGLLWTAALGILGGLIAFGISFFLPKEYKTNTTLLVIQSEGDQENQNMNVNDITFN